MTNRLNEQNIEVLSDNSFNDFLAEYLKSDEYQISEIAGDASLRKYYRINSGDKRFILMDSSYEPESIKPFIFIDELLFSNNYSTPEILHRDVEKGFLLLEDFGDDLLARIITQENEEVLYKESVDLLIDLQSNSTLTETDIAKYNDEKYLEEANLFIDWYLPLFSDFSKQELSELESEYAVIINSLTQSLSGKYSSLVLRDYHAENIIYLSDRAGVKKIGLLDFQDALIGHKAYDLVSLLEDARRDVPIKIQQDMLNIHISKLGLSDTEAKKFKNDYFILGAQRNLKIIGIFSRLSVRDKKDRYLDLIPRVKNYLRFDIENIEDETLKNFLIEKCKIF